METFEQNRSISEYRLSGEFFLCGKRKYLLSDSRCDSDINKAREFLLMGLTERTNTYFILDCLGCKYGPYVHFFVEKDTGGNWVLVSRSYAWYRGFSSGIFERVSELHSAEVVDNNPGSFFYGQEQLVFIDKSTGMLWHF